MILKAIKTGTFNASMCSIRHKPYYGDTALWQQAAGVNNGAVSLDGSLKYWLSCCGLAKIRDV